jgi:rhodanese-related sulfurtransferase
MMKKHMVILLLIVSFSLLLFGCASDSTYAYIDLSPEEAKELIDNTPDIVIIDVSPFYVQGHIPGSINYYLGDGSLDDAIPSLDKSKVYLVYCHVDSVSIAGANKLIDAGFETVYRLEGNYSAWVEAGYPVDNG